MSEMAAAGNGTSDPDLADLTAIVRRVVAARVSDRHSVDDIVQETLVRLLSAHTRLDDASAGPYAIVTARNLVTSQWRRAETGRRHEHELADRRDPAGPVERIIELEEAAALRAALDRLAPHERSVLLDHEVDGRDTTTLAQGAGTTTGAIAALLNRSRAKLRVEYLLELEGPPPTSKCRPVLLALSAGDRQRQGQLDAGHHLLDCDYCAALSEPLFERKASGGADEIRIPVRVDADIVVARQRGRELAIRAGFSPTDATVIATAISELARNIVRFARRGEVRVSIIEDGGDVGIAVVAQDAGPGIADVSRAVEEGYSTYGGKGFGLPGSKRLMDEFDIASEVGRGTTVTMTKWIRR